MQKKWNQQKCQEKAPRKSVSTRIRTAGHSEIDEKGVPRQRQIDAPGMEMEVYQNIFMTYEATHMDDHSAQCSIWATTEKLELDQQEKWIRTE